LKNQPIRQTSRSYGQYCILLSLFLQLSICKFHVHVSLRLQSQSVGFVQRLDASYWYR
jgi:hypothetical protein